jgi:hypothetical protein
VTRLRAVRVATLVIATLAVIALINFPDVLPPGIRGMTAGVVIGVVAYVYRETTRRETP